MMLSTKNKTYYLILLVAILVVLQQVSLVVGDCTCDRETLTNNEDNKNTTLKYKLWAIAAILVSSALGISLPMVGKNFPALNPESNLFFLVKTFAAGVILSTGFIHILPDAFEDLTNPCLDEGSWGSYPFTGLFAMIGALGSLMIDAFATGHYRRVHFAKPAATSAVDEEMSGAHAGHLHLHTHATHGHAHGSGLESTPQGLSELDRIRYKVTSQAAFKSASTLCMALFFSLTTPVGIAIGIGITNVYDESSPTALIVQGLLNAVAAGILIYMALVDLLAQDFMNPKMQANNKLFFGANITLLLGAGFMAVLAIWA
ncbi:Zinc transporter 1 [Bienertia sinuspersici]